MEQPAPRSYRNYQRISQTKNRDPFEHQNSWAHLSIQSIRRWNQSYVDWNTWKPVRQKEVQPSNEHKRSLIKKWQVEPSCITKTDDLWGDEGTN